MNKVKEKKIISPSLRVSLIAVSGALYAVAVAVTASIPTPWGVGMFRPGVLIPAFFALAFGPIVGGSGAAIGTFVGEALTGFANTTPLLSLFAGVPSNFAGFYLLGLLMKKRSTWGAFVVSTFLSLVVGNLIAGALVVGFFIYVAPLDLLGPLLATSTTAFKLSLILGFTFYWVATMIPFVIPLMPPLVRAAKPVLGSSLSSLSSASLSWGKPKEILKATIAVSLSLAALYALVTLTPLGDLMFTLFTASWVETLILISSIVVLVFGLVAAFLTVQKKTGQVAGKSS